MPPIGAATHWLTIIDGNTLTPLSCHPWTVAVLYFMCQKAQSNFIRQRFIYWKWQHHHHLKVTNYVDYGSLPIISSAIILSDWRFFVDDPHSA
jgi:hypothetical protein